LLGYFGKDDFSETFWDAAESLPGCFLIQREVKKAVQGENFFYNDGETGKPVRCEGITYSDLMYYVTFWDDFHYLKVLPSGRGTMSERRWLIDSIKLFEKCFLEIQNFLEDKARRKAERENGRN
jgi:hypothetical protein